MVVSLLNHYLFYLSDIVIHKEMLLHQVRAEQAREIEYQIKQNIDTLRICVVN